MRRGGETITPSWNWQSNSTIKRDVNLQSPKCQFDFKTTEILANQLQIQTKTQPEKISHPKLIVSNIVATRGVNNNISPEIKKEKICKARKTSYASYCKSTEKETHDEIPHYKETTNQASLYLQRRYVYIQCKYNPLINIFSCMCWSMDCYDANPGGQGFIGLSFIGLQDVLKTPSRRLGGKQNVYWWYLYLTNLNVYLTNICFTNLYLTNLRRVQNALLRTQ